MIPLTKKYAPTSLKEVVGQEKATKEIQELIPKLKDSKQKAIWLYGLSGVGKTSIAIALAKDLNFELIEVNASDFRNADQIEQKIGSAMLQQSLFSQGKVILIDEVDGISGQKDRGGLPTLIKLIDKTVYPVILTATNPWDSKYSTLRKRTHLIQLDPVDHEPLSEFLIKICKEENIKFDADTIKSLARRTGGDVRAALNDLQTLTEMGADLTKDSLDELAERSHEESMPQALMKIFKSTDPKVAIKAFDNVREDLDQQLLWLDHNLPLEYDKPQDLARAYDKLSKADVFNRRIRRWQHWRFLVYINALITAGVAVSKDEKYKKFVQYKPTGRLLKLWWAKQKSMKKKAIAQKLAQKTHSSTKEHLKYIEHLKLIFKKNSEMASSIAEYAELDKDEVAWLKK